jgi:glycosyltransferase involved in cell wall biosynthesis
MACGVPVISSAVTSIPEVCGDAALLVNPEDISAISTAMQQIATDENLRQNLIEKGFERIKFFTWQKTAQLLWQSCEKVIEIKKPR